MRRTNTIHDAVPSLEELKLRWEASIEQFHRDFAHCLVLLEENRLLREHSQALHDDRRMPGTASRLSGRWRLD